VNAIEWYAVSGIIFGIAGIVATIVIALTVYWKQKRDGKELQDVVDSIHILTQQENSRRERHIRWLTHHSVNVLEDARKDYTELRGLLCNFRTDRTQENLNILQVRSKSLLGHLNGYTIPFLSDNIKKAFDYINNPWLTNHFLYELQPLITRPCLSINESDLYPGMNYDKGLLDIQELINDTINRIDGYITTIREEQG
jgi:hypothetical protein